MEKAYSYRFYPTPEQESLLRRTLGCVRLVYNKVRRKVALVHAQITDTRKDH
ncbi:MAG: helix-turn-helix domain-containing protein, partial [Jaaginema sp. PMC 1079.18]|nr:helix-turn-helix domain-containing protein [Jaaginema sp. PMC 1079.18]MEC4867937.1 helix-turn-helix domain-containing protein [Jaaginema sp. PMC 1078.18]